MPARSQNIMTVAQSKGHPLLLKAAPIICILLALILWQLVSALHIVQAYMLPSPLATAKAFIGDFRLLCYHLVATLQEAVLGLLLSLLFAFVTALVMDSFAFVKAALYPLLVVTQTVPTIAIAPLLILWLGYGIAPKVALIVITCYFPLTISLLTGFASADCDTIKLLQSMGAHKKQIFTFVKVPASLPHFFSGLKISVSYSLIGAVISEWLGGMRGLGVYMIRVKKSYSFDKMFAVIFLISALSLLLMKVTGLLEKKLSWER